MKPEFHPLAAQELNDATDFYENQTPGLGSDFLDELERILGLLESLPDIGRPTPRDLRTFPTRQFPYSLVYRNLTDHVFILAVAHQRRRPRYWAGRANSGGITSAEPV